MTLAERLRELVRAAFSGLYVQSFEHQDAVAEIARLCHQERWTLATWDVDRGLAVHVPATRRPCRPTTRSPRCARWGHWPRPTHGAPGAQELSSLHEQRRGRASA